VFHVKQVEPTEFGVSHETEQKLRAFLALLQRWNARINLVADRDESVLWRRHILDSLQLLPLLPEGGGPIIDLGSGAGFPGLVLALASGRPTHLVEADRRKAAFLIEAVRILGLAETKVHSVRIEATALPSAQVVSARALAPLAVLLRHAHRLLAPGGTAIFPKGRTAEQELTEAARHWNMRVERFPSRTDPDSLIFRISEISPAGAKA
jgi:16S rRNA (guanine(527)-N(7))-methyltransferase RsmG